MANVLFASVGAGVCLNYERWTKCGRRNGDPKAAASKVMFDRLTEEPELQPVPLGLCSPVVSVGHRASSKSDQTTDS